MQRAGRALEALPFGVALTLLAALPSYFNLATDQIFEEEKSLLLRAGAFMALPALIALARSDSRRLLNDATVLLFGALLAALAISTVFAIVPYDALMGAHLRRHGLLTWAALATLFAALLQAARSAEGRDLIVRAMVVGSMWPSIYLLLQRAGFDPVQWLAPSEGFKPGGTFGNHVMMGGYVATVVPLAAYQAWRSRGIWIAGAILPLAALVATASRGAAVALSIALAVTAAILVRNFFSRRMTTITLVAGGTVLVIIAAVPGLRPAVIDAQLNPSVGSARVRILIWRDTLAIIRESGSRAVVGHGPESLAAAFPKHYSPEIGYWEQIDAMPDRAHNETLDMLVWSGALGAVLELLFFAAVLFGALRVNDVALRCALCAAAAAHVVEIQFGIASVTARLCFLAVAALVVGSAHSVREQRPPAASRWWLAAAAVAGAAAPCLSILPSLVNNPVTSGGEQEFLAYLRYLSSAIPVLYAGFLVIAFALADSMRRSSRLEGPWWRLACAGGGAWLAVVLCIEPSRADALTAAGRSYERDGRWAEASSAYGAAARAQPRVAEYHSSAGRASLQWALASDAQARDRLLDQGRASLQRAADLNGFDIDAQRRLAAYPRIRASLVQGAERDELLRLSDSAYAKINALAPTSPAVLVEWAWVDVDRGRLDDARRKVDTALTFNRRHPAALALQDHLK